MAVGAVLALDDPLQPERKTAGNPATAPAPSIDCTNLRRVRRKLNLSSFNFGMTVVHETEAINCV
jgi:hypothetical protein